MINRNINRYLSLLFLIAASLMSFDYIYSDSNDKVISVAVKYNRDNEKCIFKNMNNEQINDFVNEIVDNLILRKSASEENKEIVIKKFKENNIILENKYKETATKPAVSFLFASYGIKGRKFHSPLSWKISRYYSYES